MDQFGFGTATNIDLFASLGDEHDIVPQNGKMVERFGEDIIEHANNQTQLMMGGLPFNPLFPILGSASHSSEYPSTTSHDIETSYLVSNMATSSAMLQTPSPSDETTITPRYPFTSAYIRTTSAMEKTEDDFFKQLASLPDPETGELYHGTYRELKARHPELRRTVAECLDEWTENNRQALNHSLQRNAQRTLSNAIHTDVDAYGTESSCQHEAQGNHLPIPRTQTPTSGSAKRAQPKLFPLLKTVPKRKGMNYEGGCKRCRRKVVVNGNNDGEHCTRCFKKCNTELEFQNGLILHSLRSPAPINSPSGLNSETVARTYDPSDIRNSIRAGDIAYGAAGLMPVTPHNIGSPIDTAKAERYSTMLSTTSVGTQNAFIVDELNDSGAEENGDETNSVLDLEHRSIDAAREYLIHPPGNACQRLNLADDDFQSVKEEKFHDLCVQLFRALRAPGAGPPDDFTDEEKMYFNQNHAKMLEAVKRDMKTPAQKSMIKARIIVMMADLVRVHEVGIPKTVFDKSDPRSHRGYEPQVELTCGARAENVVEYARRNKYVALDIVRDKKLDYLIQAPDRYVERKLANLKTNVVRGNRLQMVKNLKQGEGKKAKCTTKTTQATQTPEILTSSGPTYSGSAKGNKDRSFQTFTQQSTGIEPPSVIQQSVGQLGDFISSPASSSAVAGGARKRTYEVYDNESVHANVANKHPRVENAIEDQVDWYNL